MTPPQFDAHWLDFYALLGVPAGADEDAIRKRLGKIYAEAAANSDHRDLARRHYFQALLERVLPQCRRVLLDAEWRARYDRQHLLNAQGDPSAQNYVAFIASMRAKSHVSGQSEEEILPQRLQEEINLAREVVECAWQGAQLDLLPTCAVSSRENFSPTAKAEPRTLSAPVAEAVSVAAPPQIEAPIAPVPRAPQAPIAAQKPAATPIIEEIVQSGTALHAQVITGAEAAAMRRERASQGAREGAASPALAARSKRPAPMSRFAVGSPTRAARVISPTAQHLMVAIVGVLLTITIQQFSGTPAVADGAGRTPIFVAVAPEMEGALARAEAIWEQTPEGARFDVVVQATGSSAGVSRALGAGGALPDAWIPADTSYVERYNRRATALKRQTIAGEAPLAQSPMVLMARSERAGELLRLFPNHQISSWQALRTATLRGAVGHLGLADPQKTESGALARVSMAREWGAPRGLTPIKAAKNPEFWRWMAAFEDNAPSASARSTEMVKDMAQGTTGRFWWVVAYESDALQWMNAGKRLEIFYLPRTTYANHPFCTLERVGAGGDVAAGRAAFEKYLRSQTAQKALLNAGFRPAEISLKTKTERNPFLRTGFRAHGARTEGLPLEERVNSAATEMVAQQWGNRYG